MSLNVVAASKMYADRQGQAMNVNESTPPTADGPASHPTFTDLGGLDHLFRDPSTTLQHLVSVPLETATSSLQGPYGGRRPGYLQHAVAAARVDGQELLASDTGQPNAATSGAKALGARVSQLLTVGGVDNTGISNNIARTIERVRNAFSVPKKA